MDISVVVPVYNSSKYISQCLRSILNQTYPPQEIIVVDDGSVDNSLDVIRREFGDKVKLIVKANGGASSARNAGIRVARHDWIAFCDSDDIWLPDHLHSFVTYMMDECQGRWYMSLLNAHRLNDNELNHRHSNEIEGRLKNKSDYKYLHTHIKHCDYLNDRNLFGLNISIDVLIAQKNILKEVGGFNEALKTGGDVDLLVKLALRERLFVFNPRITALVRKNDASLSSNKRFSYKESSSIIQCRIEEINNLLYIGRVKDSFRVNLWIFRLIKRTIRWGSVSDLFSLAKEYRKYVSVRHQLYLLAKQISPCD